MSLEDKFIDVQGDKTLIDAEFCAGIITYMIAFGGLFTPESIAAGIFGAPINQIYNAIAADIGLVLKLLHDQEKFIGETSKESRHSVWGKGKSVNTYYLIRDEQAARKYMKEKLGTEINPDMSKERAREILRGIYELKLKRNDS